MNSDMTDSSPQPSPAFTRQAIPPKRRKLGTSTNTEEECQRLTTLLETVRARLARTEATATQLYRIRREVDEIFLREQSQLQNELQNAEERMDYLKGNLVTATKKNQELCEALMAAKTNFVEMKNEMGQRIEALSMENAKLKASPIFANCGDAERAPALAEYAEDEKKVLKKKLKAAEKKILELKQMLEDNMISRTKFIRQKIQLRSAKIAIRRLKAAEKQKTKRRSQSKSRKDLNPEDIELAGSENHNCSYSQEKIASQEKKSSGKTVSANNLQKMMQLCPKILSVALEPVKKEALVKKGSMHKRVDEADEEELMLERNKESGSREQSPDTDTSSEISEQARSPEDTGEVPRTQVSMEDHEPLMFQVDDYIPGEFQMILLEDEPLNTSSYRDFGWSGSNGDNCAMNLQQDVYDFEEVDEISVKVSNQVRSPADTHVLKECHVVLIKDDSLFSRHNKNQGEDASNFEVTSTQSDQETSVEGTMALSTRNEDTLGDQLFEPHVMLIEDNYPTCDHYNDPLNITPDSYYSDVQLASLHDLEVKVGKHSMLVSNPKFFQMDWRTEYSHIGKNKWSCNKCDWIELRRFRIQDHVWVVHYEESFKCPHCPFNDEDNNFMSRSNMRRHLKQTHPDFSTELKRRFQKSVQFNREVLIIDD